MNANSDTYQNVPAWPMDLLDAAAVREWISAALLGQGTRSLVVGPVEVYQEKGWGVTARCSVTDSRWGDGVVFYACALPIYGYTPYVYRLLMPRVPGHVPELLTWTNRGGQLWSLFRLFTGEKIGTAPSMDALQDLARLMAHIQARSAESHQQEWGKIPHLPVGRPPALFDEILADVRDQHLVSVYGR